MFLLSKVRDLNDYKKYEVTTYDINSPNNFYVDNTDSVGLSEYLSKDDKDFSEFSGLLLTTAETCDYDMNGSFEVNFSDSIFTLLSELVQKRALYIPTSIFEKDIFDEDINTSFSNLRISESSMFVGLSVKTKEKWKSYTIVSVVDNVPKSGVFYIGLPKDETIDTINLECVQEKMIHDECYNIYKYDGNMSIVPKPMSTIYYPKPIFNYLNISVHCYKNAIKYLEDLDIKDTVTPDSYQKSGDREKKKECSVRVKSSIPDTAKQDRKIILNEYLGKDVSVLCSELNILDAYSMNIVNSLHDCEDTNTRHLYIISLKKEMNKYALALMQFRYLLLYDPLFFGENNSHTLCKGGGGERFYTTLTLVNNTKEDVNE